jgi:hypothetical protein
MRHRGHGNFLAQICGILPWRRQRPLGKCHRRLNYTPSTTTRQLPSRSIFKGRRRVGKGRKLEDADLWRVGICIAKNRVKCSGDGVDLVLRLFTRDADILFGNVSVKTRDAFKPRSPPWLQPKRPHHSSSMQTKATTGIVQ